MQIRIHMSELDDFDPGDPKVKNKKKIIMPKPPELPGEETILGAASRIYSELDQPYSKVVGDAISFSESPKPGIRVLGNPKYFAIYYPSKATVALGPSASAGAAVSLGVSAGVFFSNATPHVGLYGSVDVGIITNLAAAVVVQAMYLFGDPAFVFKGPPTVLIGVNVGGPKIITGSGFLVLHETTPFTVIGVGLALGVGASLLPVDLYLTKSYGVSTV